MIPVLSCRSLTSTSEVTQQRRELISWINRIGGMLHHDTRALAFQLFDAYTEQHACAQKTTVDAYVSASCCLYLAQCIDHEDYKSIEYFKNIGQPLSYNFFARFENVINTVLPHMRFTTLWEHDNYEDWNDYVEKYIEKTLPDTRNRDQLQRVCRCWRRVKKNEHATRSGFNAHKRIGYGTYSSVFESFDRRYAIKLYTDWEDCIRELSTLIWLQIYLPRHVITINEFGMLCNKNLPYIIMPKARHTLQRFLASFEVTTCQMQTILHDICIALKQAHALNIAHRDVHPGNILLFDAPNRKYFKYRVVLADWGMSRKYSSKKSVKSSEEVTVIYYRAPEVFYPLLIEDRLRLKMDVWSLGRILHALVDVNTFRKTTSHDDFEQMAKYEQHIGLMPWSIVTNREGLQQRREEFFKQFQHEQTRDLLQHMLHYDIEKRFGVTQILNHPFMCNIDFF